MWETNDDFTMAEDFSDDYGMSTPGTPDRGFLNQYTDEPSMSGPMSVGSDYSLWDTPWDAGFGDQEFGLYGQSAPGMQDMGFLNQYMDQPSMSGPMSIPMGPNIPGSTGGMGWGDLGSVGATLKDLFSSPTGGALVKGLGALLEGGQNKRLAKDMRNIVQQQQARQSPFDVAGGAPAGSMRAQMQQALTGAMNNPMAVPHIKAQVDQIAKAQAIKDAAAGRRSNSATSSPAMLASQGKVVQDYINSLYNPAGAFMQPSMGGLEQLINASKYNTQGYASPIMSAVGYEQRNSQSQAMLDALKEILSGGK